MTFTFSPIFLTKPAPPLNHLLSPFISTSSVFHFKTLRQRMTSSHNVCAIQIKSLEKWCILACILVSHFTAKSLMRLNSVLLICSRSRMVEWFLWRACFKDLPDLFTSLFPRILLETFCCANDDLSWDYLFLFHKKLRLHVWVKLLRIYQEVLINGMCLLF